LGSGGFAIFSCFGGAFEADCVDTSANFSHSRIEHLGALGAFCLGVIRRWRGQDGRSDWGGGFRLDSWFLSIEIVVLHVLENDGVRGEGIIEILGVHRFFHEQELFVGEEIHQDHDPDVVGAYGARGCFVEDGIELAAVVSEVVD